jgi:hypothetical protein
VVVVGGVVPPPHPGSASGGVAKRTPSARRLLSKSHLSGCVLAS